MSCRIISHPTWWHLHPLWIPRGQNASLARGLTTHLGNLASATITSQCVWLPTRRQETDSEASSPTKPALLAPVQQYLLTWQMGTGGDPAVDLREACACQVNVGTAQCLPSGKELLSQLLGYEVILGGTNSQWPKYICMGNYLQWLVPPTLISASVRLALGSYVSSYGEKTKVLDSYSFSLNKADVCLFSPP